MDQLSFPDQALSQTPNPEINPNLVIQGHILKGADYINNGEFTLAITHFRDKKLARNIGYNLAIGVSEMMAQDEISKLTEPEISSIANDIARHSMFLTMDKTIVVSGVITPPGTIIPPRLLEESALVHLEEWIHAFQQISGGPLTNHQDYEIDAAAYMRVLGIKPTPLFMLRYDRGLILHGRDPELGHLPKIPAYKRGVFVNVARPETIESDWQIFDFQRNGDVQVVKCAPNGQLITKDIPRDIFVNNNLIPIVQPFSKCASFEELFMALGKFPQLFSGAKLDPITGKIKPHIYQSSQLKEIINQIRTSQLTTSHLPRAGGLRDKVIDLLK